MTFPFFRCFTMVDILGWLVIGLMIALYLLGVVVVLFWFPKNQAPPATPTRVFLVCLRLAIAWHFLIEGTDKVRNPSWSSEPYLREATGPLAPAFRSMAGDPLLARLALTSKNGFPEALDADWQNYLDAYTTYYDLDTDQAKRAADLMRQTKQDMAIFLASQPRIVEKPAAYPPPLRVPMIMSERLRDYVVFHDKVVEVETDILPKYGPREFDQYRTAKANLNKWRAGLQKDLAFLDKQMKRSFRALLLDFLSAEVPAEVRTKLENSRKDLSVAAKDDERTVSLQDWDDVDAYQEKWHEKVLESFRKVLGTLPAAELDRVSEDLTNARILTNVIARRGKDASFFDPLPFVAPKPLSTWTLLEWSNVMVKYGIFIVGIALLLGLFTRTACLAGAGFLLLFFLAMPPLPGWPEGPRAEGHYLFINKNIIEMLALLTLATTRSGRWLGIDAWLQFLSPSFWRSQPIPITIKK